MKLYRKTIKDVYWYVFIFFMLHVTGNPFYISDKYTIIAISILFFMILFSKQGIKKKDMYFFMALVLPLFGTMVVNFDFDISSYGHFVLVFMGALFLGNVLLLDKFSYYYTRIMTFLALISVIVWIVYNIYPQITNWFPNSMVPYEDDVRVYVNGAFLYTFLVSFGYGNGMIRAFERNNGIFWEPGAYQYFLILALILLLEKEKDKGKLFKATLLIVTLFTTGSTTGILCMLGCVFIYRKEISKLLPINSEKVKRTIFLLLAGIGVTAIGLSNIGTRALNKFSSNEYDPVSRIGISSLIDYFRSDRFHLLFGMGIRNQKEYGLYCDNTILYCIIVLGIVFGGVFLYLIYISCKRNFYHSYGVYILILFSFMSEVWILKFFVISIIFMKSSNKNQRCRTDCLQQKGVRT